MSLLCDGRALPLVQIEFQDYRQRHEGNQGNISKLPIPKSSLSNDLIIESQRSRGNKRVMVRSGKTLTYFTAAWAGLQQWEHPLHTASPPRRENYSFWLRDPAYIRR